MVNPLDRSRRPRCQEDIAVRDDLAGLSPLPRFVGSPGTARVADGSDAGRVFASGQCDGGAHQHIKEARVHYASLRGFDPGNHQQTYLARYRGQPAGCSILQVAAGVAGVYQVVTLPDARGRGIGRAMTIHALLEGKMRGCDVGGLHATPMGVNLYRSIGFVEHPPVKLFFGLPSR